MALFFQLSLISSFVFIQKKKLREFLLYDRFVKKDSVSVFHKQIEYDVVNKRLDAMRQESYRYISNCLNMVKDGKNM